MSYSMWHTLDIGFTKWRGERVAFPTLQQRIARVILVVVLNSVKND